MTAADRQALAAALEAIAAELASAEARTDESSKAYGERVGDPRAASAHQVGALAHICGATAGDIRRIIALHLAGSRKLFRSDGTAVSVTVPDDGTK